MGGKGLRIKSVNKLFDHISWFKAIKNQLNWKISPAHNRIMSTRIHKSCKYTHVMRCSVSVDKSHSGTVFDEHPQLTCVSMAKKKEKDGRSSSLGLSI